MRLIRLSMQDCIVGPGNGSLGGRTSRSEHAACRRPAVRVALTRGASQRRRGIGSQGAPPDNGRRRRQRSVRLCPAAGASGAARSQPGKGEAGKRQGRGVSQEQMVRHA